MNRIEKFKAQIKEIDGKLDALLAGDQLTEDQQKEHDGLVADRAKCVADLGRAIEGEEGRLVREQEMSALEGRAVAVADAAAKRPTGTGRKTPAAVASELATRVNISDGEHGPIVSYFEPTDEEVSVNVGDSPDAVRRQSYKRQKRQSWAFLKSSGYQPWGEFKNAREFIRTGLNEHTHSSFKDRVGKHYAAVTGMSESVGSDGGYLVMPELASGILDRVYSNDLWSRTDNYTVSGNSMTFVANAETSRATGSRHGGLRGYWLGEGATKTPSKPALRAITMKLVKLAVVVYLTDELLEDTGNVLSTYVTRKVSEEINFMIGDALVNGTGVGQPLGLLNWPSLVSVAKEAGQLADTLETENIIKMFSRFYAPNRGKMIWLHNQDIEPELFTMTLGVGTGGVVTYMPPGGLSSAPYATLMGRPIFPTEFNPTLGDQGDILAADLGQMISISKGGITQAVSMHVEFLTDQTALRFVMRLNAGPWESSALTPYKGTNTTSNAVTLDARA